MTRGTRRGPGFTAGSRCDPADRGDASGRGIVEDDLDDGEGHPVGRWRHRRHHQGHGPGHRRRHPRGGSLRIRRGHPTGQATAPPGISRSSREPALRGQPGQYKRHLRYVVRKSTKADISAMQISNGAKARYDSLDGYQWHPRQAKYRTLDDATADYQCLLSPAPVPVRGQPGDNPRWGPPIRPAAGGQPVPGAGQPRRVAHQPRPRLRRHPDQYKPIRITGPDYHGLDRDGDGWGCDV